MDIYSGTIHNSLASTYHSEDNTDCTVRWLQKNDTIHKNEGGLTAH